MTYALAENITLTETEQGAVVLDERSGVYRILNPTGVIVLHALLDEDDPVKHAIAVLTARYPEAADRIPDDVAALAQDLESAKVVVS